MHRKNALAAVGMVCSGLETAQPLVGREGVDRPELRRTISTLVGFSRAQITCWVREYLVRDNIKAISTTVMKELSLKWKR